MRWSGRQLRSSSSLAQLDKLLVNYLEFQYLEGADLSRANYIAAAVMYMRPETRTMAGLPRAQQSLRGWRRLCPPRARMPIPYEVVCRLVEVAAREKQAEIGLLLLLSFFLYLRPSEPYRIRVSDIISPVASGGRAFQHHAVLLHPLEEGVPSKTKQWDEMLLLDLPHQSLLGPCLERVLRLSQRPSTDLAFTVSKEQVSAFLEQRWTELGLTPLGLPHLYRVRHGGASRDAAGGLRELSGIQSRGRWQTMKSVKTYEKGGRLQQLFKSLSPSVQRQCLGATSSIVRICQSLR